MLTGSKVITQTDRHTHTDMRKTLPLPHMREVTKSCKMGLACGCILDNLPVIAGFVADPEVYVLCPVLISLPILHLYPYHVIT